MSGKEMTVNDRIREDYGTLTHFCKKHDINIRTFRHVLAGYGKSKPITDLLRRKKYIRSAKELERDTQKAS